MSGELIDGLPFTPCVEIGWRLPRWARGHGYASEAARAALDVGFTALALEEVVSFTKVTNTRSQAVIARIGMSRDGTADFHHPAYPADDPGGRSCLYRLDAASWRAAGPSPDNAPWTGP